MDNLMERILTAAAAGYPCGSITDDDVRALAEMFGEDTEEASGFYQKIEAEARSDLPMGPIIGRGM